MPAEDPHPAKATVAEIRERFENDVERFSNLETGQMSTQDAPLVLDLIARSARAANPGATSLLDLGCGAGNFSLRLAREFPLSTISLVDLSPRMLARAAERLGAATTATVETHAGDIREVELGESRFDVVVAAAVLHHLREEKEWVAVFDKIYRALRPGGSFWVWDLIEHNVSAIRTTMWHYYGEHLTQLRGDAYRDHVFSYIAHEDSPRSVPFQFSVLARVGFTQYDLVHKHGCFAAFGATKL